MAENKLGESTEKRAGNRGRGRPKGSKNKITALLKDQILEAGANAHPEGMVGYLTHQANENPTAFMTLIGKVLPTQLETGPGGITIQLAERAGKF